MPNPVDEQRRRRVEVHRLGVLGVVGHPVQHLRRVHAHVLVELIDVAARRDRVAIHVRPLQVVLVVEQLAGHLPEPALQCRRFAGPGRVERARVCPFQREMSPDVTQPVAEVVAHLVDGTGRATAERALEVAVFDQRQRCVVPPADVVAVGVHGPQQLEPDRLGRAEPVGDTEHRPAEHESQHRRRQHTDAGLILALGFGDRDVDDEQRDGEADSGQCGAAGDAPQRQPRHQNTQPAATHEPGGGGDADELAQHQPGDDAPGQRRPQCGGQGLRIQPYPGVDQREQRQDEERHRGPDALLQPLVDRDRLPQRATGRPRVLRVR